VQTYHSAAIATKTLDDWSVRFSEKRLSETELPEFTIQNQDALTIVVDAYAEIFGLNKSRADARRLIEQGSVQLDGAKIADPKAKISPRSGQVLRLDKTHAVRVK
jgi:tyrosyl-tRNA synthetase